MCRVYVSRVIVSCTLPRKRVAVKMCRSQNVSWSICRLFIHRFLLCIRWNINNSIEHANLFIFIYLLFYIISRLFIYCAAQLVFFLDIFLVFIAILLLFNYLLYIRRKPRMHCIFWYTYIKYRMHFSVKDVLE